MNTKPLLYALAVIAGIFFGYAIIANGLYLIGKAGSDINDWMANVATIISGVLSTNLGAVLGFTVTPPRISPQTSTYHPKTFGFRPSVSGTDPQKPTGPQKLQVLTAYVYLIGLLIAAIFWFVSKDHESGTLIFTLTNTLAGVVIGALTVSLGK